MEPTARDVYAFDTKLKSHPETYLVAVKYVFVFSIKTASTLPEKYGVAATPKVLVPMDIVSPSEIEECGAVTIPRFPSSSSAQNPTLLL